MAEVETTDLIGKVRKIEIKTRGLTRQVFAGEYHSAFKGRGVTFSEVREYQYGDDIRNIDWNVTARFNHPYIKIFEEERELTVMLMVDVSGSRNFGSDQALKKNVITEISAVLSFSAIFNNDKIGVIFFSDKVEKFIPPKKGRKHILHIIRELIEFKPASSRTDMEEPLRFLTNAIKKKCTAFVLSDFISPSFEDSLKIAARKHDIVALHIYDKRETEMPAVGLVKFTDPETGAEQWIDTDSQAVRKTYRTGWIEHSSRLSALFARCGVDMASVDTSEDYVKPLIKLFKRRG
ncbi:MAG TPA: DUF58 domain-containing protein [Bacteroidales bacterium]|nr:DUF58 domain-containing protein [Bacteroidales bacterium]